jgi:hypothetical protein
MRMGLRNLGSSAGIEGRFCESKAVSDAERQATVEAEGKTVDPRDRPLDLEVMSHEPELREGFVRAGRSTPHKRRRLWNLRRGSRDGKTRDPGPRRIEPESEEDSAVAGRPVRHK